MKVVGTSAYETTDTVSYVGRTRQDQDERVPYKAKVATPDDFFSSFLAKPDVTNNTISSSREPTLRRS